MSSLVKGGDSRMAITSVARVVAPIVAMSLLTGCSVDGTEAADPAASPTTPAEANPAPPTTPPEADPAPPTAPPEAESPVATEAPAETEAPAAELEDGRHPAYITAIDVNASTITVDVIQFLTGEDAVAAYAEEHPDASDGPPNEYYILNDNPRLRTLPAASDVAVTVLWLDSDVDTENISFDELPAYFATNPNPESPYEWLLPFWLTVRDGQVTAIEEQYLP